MNGQNSLLGKMLHAVGDALYPQLCALCGLENPDRRICHLCREILPDNTLACERCAVPVEMNLTPGTYCADCQHAPPPFEYARAPFLYAFPVDTALKAIKFGRELHYIPAFADYLLPELEQLADRVDALLPMQLHRWRHARRGFNQAIELCKPLKRASGLPVILNVVRVKATRSQSDLNAAERKRNLKDAFAVRGKLKCRQPLIVDDVMTTGETCRQLARVLLRHGAQRVGVLVVARSTLRHR